MLDGTTTNDRPAGTLHHSMFTGPAAYVQIAPWRKLSIVGSVLVLLLLAVIFINIYNALHGVAQPVMTDELVRLTLIGMPLQQLVMIGLAIWAAHAHGARLVDALALKAPAQGWRGYGIAIGVFLLAIIAMGVILSFVSPGSNAADLAMFTKMFAGPGWWVAFLLVAVGAPISEELLFRGYLFRAVAQSPLGIGGAALVTSALFAAAHTYSAIGMAQVFVVGMLFSWILVRTGSLRVTMLIHGVFNGVQALVIMAGGADWL